MSGPPGSLAAVDQARIDAALADGIFGSSRDGALDALLAGTTDVCLLDFVITY